MKKAKGWMYLSPERHLVKLVVQSFLLYKLVDGELVIQPFTNGGVPPVKPLGFEENFDWACDNFLQLFNCHIGRREFIKVSINLRTYKKLI